MTEPTQEQIEIAKEKVAMWYNYRSGLPREKGYKNLPETAHNELVRLNALLLANRAPRWIPVEERLPEAGVEVLVTDGERVKSASLDYGSFLMCGEYEFDGAKFWMPTPEPPKGEST